MQIDPIGYGDGFNWSVNVREDPVNGSDPTGLACTTVNGKTECSLQPVRVDGSQDDDRGTSAGDQVGADLWGGMTSWAQSSPFSGGMGAFAVFWAPLEACLRRQLWGKK